MPIFERKWRYNLDLPSDLHAYIEERCRVRRMQKSEFIRRMIKMGLTWEKIEATEGSMLLVREDGRPDREVVFA